MPMDAASCHRLVEAIELEPGEGDALLAVLVGDRQVRPEPLHDELLVLRDGLEQRSELLEVHTHPVHAGVHLDVHGDLAPEAAGSLPGRRHALEGREGRRQHGGDRRAHDLGRGLGQQEDRRGDLGLAQLDALVDDGHRQAVRAGLEESGGHRHRPVAVGIGLDHRAERGAVEPRLGRPPRCSAARRGRSPPMPAW